MSSIILGKTNKVGFKVDDGVPEERFYPLKGIADIPGAVKDAFLEHGYDLNGLPGGFLKIFTCNERELGALMNVLDGIDRLDLKEVFNANLKVRYFKDSFLERIDYCMKNNIPFLNQDNTFASFLDNEETFAEYKSQYSPTTENMETKPKASNTPKVVPFPSETNIKSASKPSAQAMQNDSKVAEFPNNTNDGNFSALDAEDAGVYASIRQTLEEIKEMKQDGSVKFIVDSAISNLGDVIISDNKQYRDAGIGSLVRKATRGVAFTPEMETIINDEILVAFPDNNIGRGKAA